jgi:hypothetical protein
MEEIKSIVGHSGHSPEFERRRKTVTELYEVHGIVARFSDSTEYLEAVLGIAREETAIAQECEKAA